MPVAGHFRPYDDFSLLEKIRTSLVSTHAPIVFFERMFQQGIGSRTYPKDSGISELNLELNPLLKSNG